MTLSKPRKSYPKYQIHKSSKRTFVWWQNKRNYLGPANSLESHEAYNRFIAELAQSSARPQTVVVETPKKQCLTIGELMLAFLPWAKERVCKNEYDNIRYSLRELRKLYAHTPVDEFGPKARPNGGDRNRCLPGHGQSLGCPAQADVQMGRE